MSTVLIVAAHPDDEVLGCGGTILAHRKAGHTVKLLFLSEGVSSRGISYEYSDWAQEIHAREKMATESAKILDAEIAGFERMENLRMHDRPLLDIVKTVMKYVKEIAPDIVYTHHPGDLNTDHGVTFEAVFSACRPRDDLSVKCIRTFEVPSSTNWASNLQQPIFRPDTFVDISAFLDQKAKALSAYQDEIRKYPHPRSETYLNALAITRGSQVGLRFAEGFVTVRNVFSDLKETQR